SRLAYHSSVSHSRCHSARRQRGTSTRPIRTNRSAIHWKRGRRSPWRIGLSSRANRAEDSGTRSKRAFALANRPEAFAQGALTPGSHFVVPPRRPLLRLRDVRVLPTRGDVAVAFEARQRRIDGAARQPGVVENLESVRNPDGDGAQHLQQRKA